MDPLGKNLQAQGFQGRLDSAGLAKELASVAYFVRGNESPPLTLRVQGPKK